MKFQETMQAIVCTKYGPPEVLQLNVTFKPVRKPDEILIKVKATAVNSAEVPIRSLSGNVLMRLIMSIFFGFYKPRKSIQGSVNSGIIGKAGSKFNLFKSGDQVFGMPGINFGTYAEYLIIKENSPITFKPLKATFEEAAALIFGGSSAIYFLNMAQIDSQPGKRILIYGATGSVGTSAVQVAKYYNARVTAVCSKASFQVVKSIGADEVIDYKDSNSKHFYSVYDIVFDAVGKTKKKDLSRFLSKEGIYISVGDLDYSSETKSQLLFLKDLFDSNQLNVVID